VQSAPFLQTILEHAAAAKLVDAAAAAVKYGATGVDARTNLVNAQSKLLQLDRVS